ncbi:hypothetical protein C1645_493288 [Glomus cerebriforme]|uniref:MIR domain-containing protein n=1 Tax=Glomus cerebriforme TaxID=658196 RepID=A0A397SB53_9GLOM|nr:hypothetical protein C1645_493288 [Glomus cerebriforme]
MNFSKYNGNIHPDEWINDIQKYISIWNTDYGGFLNTAISLIDPTIKLPTGINNIEKLRDALKEDISFTIFKNTNKRKLQSLKYVPERKEESNLIRNESIVALKHVATEKYLSSIVNLRYTTGSKYQSVFVGSSEPDPNSLWKIQINKEFATYADTFIKLQHIKSNVCLGIYYGQYYEVNSNRYVYYHKSPVTEHTEGNKLKNILCLFLFQDNRKVNVNKLLFSMLWRIYRLEV